MILKSRWWRNQSLRFVERKQIDRNIIYENTDCYFQQSLLRLQRWNQFRMYENAKAREIERRARQGGGVICSRGRARSEKTVPLCRRISDAQIHVRVAVALSVRYLYSAKISQGERGKSLTQTPSRRITIPLREQPLCVAREMRQAYTACTSLKRRSLRFAISDHP